MLQVDNHKYVFTTSCPPTPNEEFASVNTLTYLKWEDSNNIDKCYIMASLSKVLPYNTKEWILGGI